MLECSRLGDSLFGNQFFELLSTFTVFSWGKRSSSCFGFHELFLGTRRYRLQSYRSINLLSIDGVARPDAPPLFFSAKDFRGGICIKCPLRLFGEHGLKSGAQSALVFDVLVVEAL